MADRQWPQLLSRLVAGDTLGTAEAHDVLSLILTGSVDPILVSAMMIAVRARRETIDELTGFASAMQDHMLAIEVSRPVTDTCGTGGDGHRTINVSTAAAFVCAAGGVAVCKHGGRAASSASGSADVLEHLGVVIDLGPREVARCVDEVGIGFAFAPIFHPAMAAVAPVRRVLGIPTAFNFLGPLVNPARASFQLVGVFDRALCQAIAQVLPRLGSRHSLVVHGDRGMDELSLAGASAVIEVSQDDQGEIETREYFVDAERLGLRSAPLEEVRGGTPRENALILSEVLGGVREDAHRDVVALNAGAALYVSGAATSLREGVEHARDILSRGEGLAVLEKFASLTRALSLGTGAE